MICKAKKPKPYEGFPLCWHTGNGQWVKKIRGKSCYFGADSDAALKLYLEQRDDLHAGRDPKAKKDALTVGELANRFLANRHKKASDGKLSVRSWADYVTTCRLMIEGLGRNRAVEDLGPQDFEKLMTTLRNGGSRGNVAVAGHVVRIRVILKWCQECGFAPTVRTGPDFKAPSKAELRKDRSQRGKKLVTRDELRTMLESADSTLKAMLLLAINAALGNADCGRLTMNMLDLDGGWLEFPRPKTGVDRRAALWPETVAAIRESLRRRSNPARGCEDLVFLTATGRSWHVEPKLPSMLTEASKTPTLDNPVTRAFSTLAKRLGIDRQGLGFYALRHTFLTEGEETGDIVAVAHIMGHIVPGMGTAYRERISDARLQRVAAHVRTWLYGDKAAVQTTQEAVAV